MQKIYSLSALLAVAALSSCGGGGEAAKESVQEEAAVVWSIEKTSTKNDAPTGKVVTNFGAEDQIVSVDKYTYQVEVSDFVLEEHIVYNNGKPANSNIMSGTNVVGHTKYSYNEAGLLTQMDKQALSAAGQMETTNRYKYEYDANGDVTAVKEQVKVNKAWTNDYEWAYTYDAEHRLTSQCDYKGDGKDRKQACRSTYTYKANGQKDSLDYFLCELNKVGLRHDARTFYEYDKEGRLKATLMHRHMANRKRDFIKSKRYEYTYDAAGHVTKIVYFKWAKNENKWLDQTTTYYTYNAEGQLETRTEEFMSKKGLITYKDTYVTPAGKKNPETVEVDPIKPVIDLDAKQKTSKQDED